MVKGQIKTFLPEFYFARACLLKANVAITSVTSATDRSDLAEAAGQVGAILFLLLTPIPLESLVV